MTNSYRLQTKDRMFVFNRPYLFHYIPHPKSYLKFTLNSQFSTLNLKKELPPPYGVLPL